MLSQLNQKDQLMIILVISVWELIWKGIALWKSARNDHKIIFLLVLLFNTVGLLPISYLLYLKYRDGIDPLIKKVSAPFNKLVSKLIKTDEPRSNKRKRKDSKK